MQSAFLWGYMATPLLGGVLADKYGGTPLHPAQACVRWSLGERVNADSEGLRAGKRVMAWGIAWFSVASMALPAAFTPAVGALCPLLNALNEMIVSCISW